MSRNQLTVAALLLSAVIARADGPINFGEDSISAALSAPAAVTSISSATSTAYPEGDFYRQLTAASGDAPDACPYHWGEGGSPFRTGPGLCDTYRVGRRWRSQYEGLVLFRDNADLDSLLAATTAGGTTIPNDPTTLTSNFEHGGGAKLLLTGGWHQSKGFELQIGYEGIFEWNAGAFNPEVPPAGPIVAGAPITQRSLTYRSSLHSLEVNALQAGHQAFRPFFGIRYLRLAEDINDFSDQTSEPIPVPPAVPFTLTDVDRFLSTNNNLIGFQLGARSELSPGCGRFSISSFGSAGVYCNILRRDSRLTQTNTVVTVDDPLTPELEAGVSTTSSSSGFESQAERIAFLGELGVAGTYRINRCLKARFGYQALLIDGVELGDALFLGSGGGSDTLFLHGWFAGIERRR